MNRLGFRVSEFEAARARLIALGERVRELRLLTHFASADLQESPMTSDQLRLFGELTQGRGHATSLANSAAIFSRPDSHGDWIRPGIALYGVSPFAGQTGADLGLTPAMRLVSTVISLREVPKDETVGYGGAWRAARASRIAIIAAGYGDGLPWTLPTGSLVRINERNLPLVGRVSMDMIAIDVTDATVHGGRCGAAVGT